MCQLVGISSNYEAEIAFSFEGCDSRGISRPPSLGFAYVFKGKPALIKSASSLAEKAAEVGRDRSRVRSRLFLCHVRFPSAGPLDGVNIHPFLAEHHGVPLAFAHSGTLRGIHLTRPLFGSGPRGPSESEHALGWMLERLPPVGDERFLAVLCELAVDLHSVGTFNFLLSDGRTMWAHADSPLYWAERAGAWEGVSLPQDGEAYRMRLAGQCGPRERSVLVATSPLDGGGDWRKLFPGQILAAREGRIV